MKENILILDALKSGKVKQEDFIEYNPDKKRKIYLNSGREYYTEFDLGWHAVIYKDFGVLLVSDQPTKAEVKFTNRGISYNWLKKYAELYENNQFNTRSVVLTRELYSLIPENLRKHDIYVCENLNAKRVEKNYERIRRRNRMRLYSSSYETRHNFWELDYYIKNMLPVIFIPANTIVEIEDYDHAGKTRENAFKIFPRDYKDNMILKPCLDELKVPIWVPLKEAMLARAVCSESFVQYVSNKKNEFFIEETFVSNKILENTEGWHPQLILKDDDYNVQIASISGRRFSEDIYDDIKNENIKCNNLKKDNPITLSKIYLRLNLKKIQMFVKLCDNVMVQVNHPQYDGSSLEKAYKLKIEDKN